MVFQCGEDVDVEVVDISCESRDQSTWSLSSKRIVIEFCQANRLLWYKKHKVYSNKSLKPLMAKF
ncbi:hypothetical protein P5673_011847 [Acropora cervicornis]|uniref:Uncharacterized protein n=1 Tax=Acropora cervicornis TaxID=6130 RepID=A0AAD9QN78_ACRCE|nr:hypothetical protein P5673_011847 [Acropora cervicornis]